MALEEETPLLSKTEESNPKKPPSPWFIIAPIFGLTFCFGGLLAPLIQFHTIVFCNRYYESQDVGSTSFIPIEDCAIPEVQSIVSEAQAIIMFLTYGASLCVASYYGALSDRKGRRVIFKISSIGTILTMACYIITINYQHIFGVSLLFVAPLIRGLLAGENILIAATQAYISDCTTPARRTIVFGHMMASLFLGITLGPTATAILFKMTQSINSIFYMVLGCNVLFFLYVQFIMPESNPLENAKPTNEEENENQSIFQRINIFGALHILYRTHSKFASRWTLLIIAMVHFLMQCVLMPPSILYAMLQFGWTAIESGFYISVTSFLKLLIVSLMLPLLAKLFHKSRANAKPTVDEEPSSSSTPLLNENVNEDDVRHIIRFDKRMVLVGISAEVVSFLMFGVAFDSKQFTAAGLVQSIGILAQPSIRSMLTTLVDPTEVGELLGAVAVVESFAMLISQIGLNTLYSVTVGIFPTLVFYVCAAIASLGLALSFFIRPATHKSNPV